MTAPRDRHVLVTGAGGFLGRHLCRALVASGSTVTAWRHRSAPADGLPGVRAVQRLAQIPAGQRIDAIVNLAGARILGMPWTDGRRRLLLESRLGTTEALHQWVRSRAEPPRVLVSASAVGYYGARGAEPVDESAAPQDSFQSTLCSRWEDSVERFATLGVRAVRLRFGVVLGLDGGALPAFLRPARLGLAAVLGSGRQGFPWIHVADAVNLMQWAMQQESLQGPVNAVAPQLVSQREFQRELCDVLSRPLWLRVPAWPLRAALGEMAELLLDGQYVVPRKATEAGFRFLHPQLKPALQALLRPVQRDTAAGSSGG